MYVIIIIFVLEQSQNMVEAENNYNFSQTDKFLSLR